MNLTNELLVAAQSGDGPAFEVIYRELAPAVAGYLAGRGVPDADAVTSDVFLALWPRLSRITGGIAGLRTLVFSIAHARMVDEYRRASRQPQTVEYDPTFDTRTEPSAESVALTEMGTERVVALLCTLTDEQRDVLLLRLVGVLPVDQVAEVIGRSAGAVKQAQRRGLLALRAHLAGTDVTL